MTEPRENEEARNVHECVPQTETSAPGDLQGDPRSIEEIKRNIFSATPSNEPNDNNLVVRTEYSQPNAPLEPAQQAACIDLNASGGSLGFSFHEPEENDERGSPRCPDTDAAAARPDLSRTSSRSSGYVGSETGEQHIHGENTAPHDAIAMRRAFIQRTSSGSLSSSLTTEDMRRLYDRELHLDGCDTCKLLREACPSKETIDFWDEVDIIGGDERKKCHSKFWIPFLSKLKSTFPDKDGFGSKQVVHLLKTLLGVEGKDDGEISLSKLVNVVRYFGPIKKDEENKCILIQHLVDIVKRSLVAVKIGKQNVKQSWFAGAMTRDEAEEALKDERDNTYLVRMSQSGSDSGNFVVSVKDSHGIHHFEIEGDPAESSKSPSLNCHLAFIGNTYDSLPSVIEDLKYNAIRDEEEDSDVNCTYICPNLPFNSVIAPYKNTNSKCKN